MLRTALFAAAILAATPVTQASYQTFIVGGEAASEGEFPFMVSLQDSYGHFCGGSLVSKNWVLTAAHCVRGGSPSNIYLGLHDQDKKSGTEAFRPARVITHPKYDPFTMDYDYALVQLSGDSQHEPISLNTEELGSQAAEFVTAGWGLTSESGAAAKILQKVAVPYMHQAACNTNYPNKITDRMICAGLANGGKDSCQGDSGGPLFMTVDGKKVLTGVVSWGEGCARAGKAGVYAKVNAELAWIQEVTAQ